MPSVNSTKRLAKPNSATHLTNPMATTISTPTTGATQEAVAAVLRDKPRLPYHRALWHWAAIRNNRRLFLSIFRQNWTPFEISPRRGGDIPTSSSRYLHLLCRDISTTSQRYLRHPIEIFRPNGGDISLIFAEIRPQKSIFTSKKAQTKPKN